MAPQKLPLGQRLVRKLFGIPNVYVTGMPSDVTSPTTTRAALSKKITTKIASYLVGLSNWDERSDADVMEQCYIWEPEVGGAIDRMSTLISQAYKEFTVHPDDPDVTKEEKEMILQAEKIWREINGRNIVEMYAEMLLTFGDLFLERKEKFGLSILPNRFVTLLENQDQLFTTSATILTDENILVFCERITEAQRLIPKEKYVHVKYKDTPIFAKDTMGRQTWGLYSVSPVQRAVLSTWQKRQTQIIDILWRWKMVPREVHSISAEIFGADRYTGTPEERIKKGQADADGFLAQYNNMMTDQQPDQGYVVLDTVKIDTLQPSKGGVAYMDSNELIKQLDDKVWTAMNVPKSVVTGESAGSYASELVVSNYVSEKVIQIASKLKPVILENMRARLKAFKSTFPVDNLDIKLELNMATSKLEIFRQAAIMGSLDSFTQDEIRELLGYKPLTKAQKTSIVKGSRQQTLGDIGRDVTATDPGVPKHPETPHSDGEHKRDAGQAAEMKSEH